MFKERFDQLLSCIEISISSFADIAGIHRTLISRFRNGHRVPKESNKSLRLMADTFLALAAEREKLEALNQLIGCSSCDSKVIVDKIIEFLLRPDESEPKLPAVKLNPFGYRLDLIMTLLEISNAKLARMVNIDASLMSRLRSGSRFPKNNNAILNIIGNQLYKLIVEQGMVGQACSVTSIKLEAFNIESFGNWLSGSDESIEGVESLIKTIGSYSYNSSIQLPKVEQCINDSILNSAKTSYQGIQGLQEAVKRFLGNVLKHKCKEIFLYSDQNMEWMTDPNYVLQWASLMVACIKAGVKIYIIHNLNRRMDELFTAINKWIPLYMSGCIFPYCSKGKYGANGFTHTRFIAPGLAAIEGCGIVGQENGIEYHYTEDQKQLEHYVNGFNKMLESCMPLVKVSLESFSDDYSKIKYVVQGVEYKNKCLPEEVIAFQKEHGPLAKLGDYEIYNLDNMPFENTRIIIGVGFVSIMKLTNPIVHFSILHPLLANALEKYTDALVEQAKEEA